jgi:lipid-binding SYLF domain-containing protein
MKSPIPCAGFIAGLLLLAVAPAAAQYRETVIVDDSRQVLTEIMAIPASGIPASLLANAQGIVIIPDLVKGGFVVGVRHGRGIAMVRDERGFWRPPSFVTLTGGSVGWQIGLQVTDIILVFKTRSSVQGLLGGKFTLGADAAAAAGPVGREAAAATDTQLLAEIFTWSRSRGLFAGISLDGSVVQIDDRGNAAFYGGANVTDPNQAIPVPAPAIALMRQVGYYTGTPGESLSATPLAAAPTRAPPPAGVAAPPAPPAAVGIADLQAQRQQLAAASLRLHTILDANWRSYLAMPAEIYAGDRPAGAESLQQTLGRFDAVARDPQYALLAQRAEFRATHEWLTRYVAASTATARSTPALPAPPH